MTEEQKISIHAPHAGSDPDIDYPDDYDPISIHAPHAGSDSLILAAFKFLSFQSTLPMRGATVAYCCEAGCHHFNPRSPCGERFRCFHRRAADSDFNPRSPCGERQVQDDTAVFPTDFNPRSPCGERLIHHSMADSGLDFNPRSPCGERNILNAEWLVFSPFQSTLPMRGATGYR